MIKDFHKKSWGHLKGLSQEVEAEIGIGINWEEIKIDTNKYITKITEETMITETSKDIETKTTITTGIIIKKTDTIIVNVMNVSECLQIEIIIETKDKTITHKDHFSKIIEIEV